MTAIPSGFQSPNGTPVYVGMKVRPPGGTKRAHLLFLRPPAATECFQPTLLPTVPSALLSSFCQVKDVQKFNRVFEGSPPYIRWTDSILLMGVEGSVTLERHLSRRLAGGGGSGAGG